MRKVVFGICLFLLSYLPAFAQEEVAPDTVLSAEVIPDEQPKYEYWVRDYYKSIPVGDLEDSLLGQTFSETIAKYQSKDFEYIESISDKIDIWSVIVDRITDFFKNLFPEINYTPSESFYNILGIIGALFVVFVLYKLFFSGKQFIVNEKIEEEESVISFVERNLLDIDMNRYINDAISEGNYALAIRYKQLLNIQLLAKKDIIYWNQNKTNLDLMDEIQDEHIKADFNKCSLLFDYVWFGDFELTKEKFDEVSMQFNEFQRRWS